MAKKHKKVEVKRPPTKRQLAKWQQQRRRQHITLVLGGLFLIFVLSYVGYGYYTDEIGPRRQPAIKVNDTIFDMGYYLEAFRIYSHGQSPAWLPIIANRTVGIIQENELMRQEADRLDIKVNDKEIDKQLKQLNLPNKKVFRDIIGGRLLRDKLMKDYFSAKVPPSGEQVRVQAMLLEDKEVAEEVAAKLKQGDDFASLVIEFSQETQTRTKKGDLGWLPRGLAKILVGSPILEEVAFSLEPGKLSQPVFDANITKDVGYWLIKVVDKKDGESVQAKVMLLGSKGEAETIKAKLEAGADFATLAKEYSQHTESKDRGGDLGWVKEDELGAIGGVHFSKAAFALELGGVSEPIRAGGIQTKGGYWLVKVIEKDSNRPIEADILEKLRIQALDDWLSELKAKGKLENYIDEKKKSWALARVTKGRQ